MNKITILSLLLFAVISGCIGIKVQSDYDGQVNFRNYKTYTLCEADAAVQDENQPLYDNSLNRTRVKNAMEKEMNKLGYIRNDDNAQLMAGFHIIIKDRTVMTTNCYGYQEYQYWPECSINTYSYTEGTLIIYVTDIAKNQVIWQGSVEGVLNIKPEQMEKAINKTVSEIFKKYPLKNGKKHKAEEAVSNL